MFDLIKKHKPHWVIGENVTGLIKMGLDDVLSDLENENYSTRAFIIPAIAVNGRHQRDRLWIIGNLNSGDGYRERRPQPEGKNIAQRQSEKNVEEGNQWVAELVSRNVAQRFDTYAEARRVLDGIPDRLDRTSALGNAVVPQIPEMIGYAILQAELTPY